MTNPIKSMDLIYYDELWKKMRAMLHVHRPRAKTPDDASRRSKHAGGGSRSAATPDDPDTLGITAEVKDGYPVFAVLHE